MVDFTCQTCNHFFSTKQQLERHKVRRFPCEPPTPIDVTIEANVLRCACGRTYKKASSLSMHKLKCREHLHKATIKAFEDDAKANEPSWRRQDDNIKYDVLDLNYWNLPLNLTKVPWNSIRRLGNECNNESDRFKCRLVGATTRWRQYYNISQEIVQCVFFDTPCNFIFYVPNQSKDEVLVSSMSEGAIKAVAMKEATEYIFDIVDEVIQEAIAKYEFEGDHPFSFFQGLAEAVTMKKDTQASYQLYQEKLKAYIKQMLEEYKDDIRAVWRHSNILPTKS